MIRGVNGHIWEQPGHSCIILQLNLDRHEEIFTLPQSSSSSPKSSSSRRLKHKPDKSTPIVVRVSVSAPSFDEMPQSIQLWQSRGTDQESMDSRFSILPRIEVFNNSFCVVTVLYREYNYLLVGMSGNLKRVSPTSPCKHNVIVSVEPAISDGKGGEPQLHPLTNLYGPQQQHQDGDGGMYQNQPHSSSSLLLSSSSVLPDININNSNPPPPPLPASSPARTTDPRQQHKSMESAFVSPPRNLEPSFPPAPSVEIIKNKGTNFFHFTRNFPSSSSTTTNPNHTQQLQIPQQQQSHSSSSSTTASIAMKRTSNGVYVPMPTAAEISHNAISAATKSAITAVAEVNDNKIDAAVKNNNNNNNLTTTTVPPHRSPEVPFQPKEDTNALHLRRSDRAISHNQRFGFISPAIPEELKFKQPVNGSLVPSPHYQKANRMYMMNDRDHDAAGAGGGGVISLGLTPQRKSIGLTREHNSPGSAGPRSASGLQLVREEQTQTTHDHHHDSSSKKTVESFAGQTDDSNPRTPSPLAQALTPKETFGVFISRFQEFNESLEELALMYLAKQARLFQAMTSGK